ncbi:hypothetical protein CVT26_000663 [Gymnopilus dilepis]|uniref:Uncharacterized protein n=1 Tax=Gymnopilus dilepis TaxID=231916 RepID=A0A409WEG8_9AGAR|nr:hypothetical protein CVT26_000663 [Gymnopilus dilepis]
MVNPGAFRGSRKDFLISQKAEYAEAVIGGYVADALANIQRRYFKRYPPELPHDEEPTPEHLAAVDDDGPDPEMEEPDAEKMSPEDYQQALKALEQRSETIRYRKAQIKRWQAYQYMKDNDVDVMEPSAENPFSALVQQLSGKEAQRPRKKTPVNVWRKTQRHNIEARVKNLAEAQGIPKDRWAALRDKVARQMFSELPAATQDKWKVQAGEESKAAFDEYERSVSSNPSTDPQDRQIAIQGLVRVTQPILETLRKVTGWNFTLLAGGPEPAHGGMLNIISVHAGLTPGDVKMNFGRSERAAYKDVIVPIFGRFLKKCFSPEECRSRALTADQGLVPLREDELENSGETLDLFKYFEAQFPSGDSPTSDGNSSTISSNHSSSPPVPTTSDTSVSTPWAAGAASATPLGESTPPSEPPPATSSSDGDSPTLPPQTMSCPTVSQRPGFVEPAAAPPPLVVNPPTSDRESPDISSSEPNLVEQLTAASVEEVPQQVLPDHASMDVEVPIGEPPDMLFGQDLRHLSPPPPLRASLPPSPRASPPQLPLSLPPSPRASPQLRASVLPASEAPPLQLLVSLGPALRASPQLPASLPPSPRASPPPFPRASSPFHPTSLPCPPSPSPPATGPASPPPTRASSPISTTLQSRPTTPPASTSGAELGYRVIRNLPAPWPSSPSRSTRTKSRSPSPSATSASQYVLRNASYPTPPVDLCSMMSTRSSRKRRSSVSSSVSTASDVSVPKRLRTSSNSSRPSKSSRRPKPSRPSFNSSQISTANPSCELALTTSMATIPSDGTPRWFEDALLMVQMKDLGPQWLTLLERWTEFEKRAEYKENGKLGSQNRPVCIGDWIQRKRSTTWRPVVEIKEMQKTFKKWWISLQPKWRLSDDGKIIRSAVRGDWSCLRKSGLNGLYSVIAGLYFWGTTLGGEGVEQDQWVKVVEDVELVIRCMLEPNNLSAG